MSQAACLLYIAWCHQCSLLTSTASFGNSGCGLLLAAIVAGAGTYGTGLSIALSALELVVSAAHCCMPWHHIAPSGAVGTLCTRSSGRACELQGMAGAPIVITVHLDKIFVCSAQYGACIDCHLDAATAVVCHSCCCRACRCLFHMHELGTISCTPTPAVCRS